MSFFRETNTGPMVLGPGDIYTFLATTEETDGAYFVLEGIVPPDAGPPPHIHHDQDESFYIVEGQLEITVGGDVREAKAGDFVHVSKGTPHSFANRSQAPAKLVATFVPAGNVEQFFREAMDERGIPKDPRSIDGSGTLQSRSGCYRPFATAAG